MLASAQVSGTDDENGAEKPASRPGQPISPTAAALQFGSQLLQAAKQAVDWKVVAALGATLNLLVYQLPPDQRAPIVGHAAEVMANAVSQGWLPWIGWALLVVALIVFIPYAWSAERRVDVAGRGQKTQRTRSKPARTSSTDRRKLEEDILARAQEMRREAGSVTPEIPGSPGSATERAPTQAPLPNQPPARVRVQPPEDDDPEPRPTPGHAPAPKKQPKKKQRRGGK